MEQTHLTGSFEKPQDFCVEWSDGDNDPKDHGNPLSMIVDYLSFSRDGGQILIRKGSKCCQKPVSDEFV